MPRLKNESENNNFNPDSTPVRRKTTESNVTPRLSSHRVLAPLHVKQTLATETTTPSPSTCRRRFTSGAINLPGTPECFSAIQMPISNNLGSPYFRIENEEEGDQSSLTVAVRVRPFNQKELSQPDCSCIISMKDKETIVKTSSNNQYVYSYDFSFWSFDKNDPQFSSQEDVYKSLAQPLLGKAFQGYNTSLFAYGQTGSGKSYSIMGYGKEEGIVPRFSRELFERIKIGSTKNDIKSNVEISFFEIYNEKIHDLLESIKNKHAKKTALKVREHPILGPYIEGLSTHTVNCFEDIECWINLGNKNRATAATGMNDKSSRSHSIFTMVLTQTKTQEIDGQKHVHSTTSKINLVDLAGSERQSTSQCSGERFREGININKSLMTLGKVISLLSEVSSNGSKKKVFIPYRDSILTWLLKESLGGNSRTAMIATISPSSCHVEETLSTLRYAQQARFIVNRVRINEDTKTKKIQELMAEIKKLKSLASSSSNKDGNVANPSLEEISALRAELEKKEKELSEIKRTLEEKLTDSEKKKKEQFQILQHSGIAFKMDNSLPHLVNLSKDPQLCGVLLYLIKEGDTKIGHNEPNSIQDIQLTGALIADHHCIIRNDKNVVNIQPIKDAPTYINGNLITELTSLSHGDTVIFGGNHFFRFVNPSEIEKSGSNPEEFKDFDSAYKELIKTQEKRLAQDLEEVKKQIHLDMVQQINLEKHRTEELLQEQKTGYEVQLSNLQNRLEEKNSQMKISQLANKELTEQIKIQKEELDIKLMSEKRRQKEFLQTTEAISKSSDYEDLLLKALQKARDGAENNLKRLNSHLQDTLNSSSSSVSTTATKSDDLNILQSPSVVYNQAMLTIDSLLNLVEDVHSHGRQSIEDIKNKQQCLNKEMFDTKQTKSNLNSGLYQTYLAILEANAICRHLKKNIVFSRDDSILEGNKLCTSVKCSHLDNKLCTFWSVDVFHSKLQHLRDLYENGDESIEAVFADEQFWENDEDWLNFTVCSEIQGLPVILASPKHVKSNFRRFSSPGFSAHRSTTTVRDSLGDISFSSYSSILASICQQTSTFWKQEENYVEWTLADKVLSCFCEIFCSVKTVIKLWPEHQQTVSVNFTKDKLCNELVFLLHKSVSLSSNSKLWVKTFTQENLYIQSICGDLAFSVEQIHQEISAFLSACSSQLSPDIQDCARKIILSIYKTLEIFAKITLFTNQNLVWFQEENSEVIDEDICRKFKDYCDAVLDKTLKGALHSLKEWEILSNSYTKPHSPEQVEIWKDIEILISKIYSFLKESKNSLFRADSETVPSTSFEFYKLSFNDCKENCFLIKSLVESIASIMLALKASKEKDSQNTERLVSLLDNVLLLWQQLSLFCNENQTDYLNGNNNEELSSLINKIKCTVNKNCS